jgi:ammonium transporter Rh
MAQVLAAQWFRGVTEVISVNITTLVTGLDLVAALLISFGGVIGKASPMQLVMMVLFECVFYAINKSVFLAGYLDFIDGTLISYACAIHVVLPPRCADTLHALFTAGGSIQIHMFGAYFGLAVAYMLGAPSKGTEDEASPVADTFSLLGTIFLWVYWPSFNGGELEPNSHAQQRAVVGTILSLCAATVGAFFASSYLNPSRKFRPVDIQNATLAGGVAIGAVCNLTLSLSDCLLIGFVAGVVSTLGFAYIQTGLEHAGVHDTCGIHNLHGLPSIVGGLASVVLCFVKAPLGHDMPTVFHNPNQASLQLMSIVVTLFFAIFTGVVTGKVMRWYAPLSSTEPFTDAPYWEGAEGEDNESGEIRTPKEVYAQHHHAQDSRHPTPSYGSSQSGSQHQFHAGVEMMHGAKNGGSHVYH